MAPASLRTYTKQAGGKLSTSDTRDEDLALLTHLARLVVICDEDIGIGDTAGRCSAQVAAAGLAGDVIGEAKIVAVEVGVGHGSGTRLPCGATYSGEHVLSAESSEACSNELSCLLLQPVVSLTVLDLACKKKRQNPAYGRYSKVSHTLVP